MNLPLFTKYPVEHFLVLSAIVFCCGIYTIISRKNAVSILMGIELVLNAANINLVAFAQYMHPVGKNAIDGPVFVLFVIVLAAAEAAVALAIILGLYRNLGRAEVEQATQMKG